MIHTATMSRNLDDDFDAMYDDANDRGMGDNQDHPGMPAVDDLDADMDVGLDGNVRDGLELDSAHHDLGGGGLGQSLADEFMDLEAEMSGVHLGDTLAGEMDDGQGELYDLCRLPAT